MAIVRYFWHCFIHIGTIFMYLQYSRPYYLSLFAKCLEGVVHYQRVYLCWSPYSTDKSISCVVSSPSEWFWRRGHNHMNSYRVSTVDIPESPISSGARGPWQQQRCGSLHCHEEWWDSVPPSFVVFSWALENGGDAGKCSSRLRLPSLFEVQRGAVLPHECLTPHWISPLQHIV